MNTEINDGGLISMPRCSYEWMLQRLNELEVSRIVDRFSGEDMKNCFKAARSWTTPDNNACDIIDSLTDYKQYFDFQTFDEYIKTVKK